MKSGKIFLSLLAVMLIVFFVIGSIVLAPQHEPTIPTGIGDEQKIPQRYLLPIWKTAQLDVQPLGANSFRLRAVVYSNLAPLSNAELSFELGDGLKFIEEPESWQGTIEIGASQTLQAKIELEQGKQHGYITLAYDYDFPADELIAYITQHSDEQYPDQELRDLLIRTINEEHRGRKEDGHTEYITK